MDLDVIALQPHARHQRAFRAFVHPCPSNDGIAPAYGFGLIALNVPSGRAIPPSSIGRIAAKLERTMMTTLYARDAAVWLTTCASSIRDELAERSPSEYYDACIGIIQQNGARVSTAFTTSGAIHATLVRGVGPRGAHATPILVPAATKSALPFTHILEGSLAIGDALVIGPRALEHVIPEAVLTQTLASLDRTNGIPYLQHAIQSADEPTGAIIALHRKAIPHHPQASMAAFLATAASTEQYLTPSLTPLVRDWWSRVVAMFGLLRVQRRHAREKPRRQLLSFAVAAIHLVFSSIGLAVKSIAAVVADGTRVCIRELRRSARVIRRAHAARCAVGTAAAAPVLPSSPRTNAAKSGWRATPSPRDIRAMIRHPLAPIASLRLWYVALPKTSQRLFILTIIFGILFFGSTIALWQQRSTELDVGAYNTTIARIEELRSIAEARILFNDTAAARSTLTEALDILRVLPQTTRPRRERTAALEREITATLDRARSLTRLAEPLRIARGGEQIPFPAIADIVPAGKRIVAIASDGTQYAIIDAKTGTMIPKILGVIGARSLTALPLDDRSFLLLDDRLQARVVDIDTGTSAVMSISASPTDIIAATTTSGRLYLLFRDGHVTKHERTSGGFADGTTIVAKGQATTDARTLAVTASIILGGTDGTVRAFPTNRRQPVVLTTDVDPPITTAPALAALRGEMIAYLGDPIEGRIIAVGTDGRIIGQIQSNAFRGLSRIIIAPNGSAVYVLHNNTISVVIPPKLK